MPQKPNSCEGRRVNMRTSRTKAQRERPVRSILSIALCILTAQDFTCGSERAHIMAAYSLWPEFAKGKSSFSRKLTSMLTYYFLSRFELSNNFISVK